MAKKQSDYLVGGMQPLTMIDFPGRLATVIFAQGCNLRCRFCYNRTLLPDRASEMLSWTSIIDFLKDRQGFIEGVVFSGGEPCRQEGFIRALEQVKELGLETALHTNGFYPGPVITALKLRLLNYVAIDFKTSFERYEELTGSSIAEDDFIAMLREIARAGIGHEVRVTVHPDIVDESEIMKIADIVADCGIEKFVLQRFQHGEALDKNLRAISSLGLKQINLIKLRQRFPDFEIRGDQTQGEIVSKLKFG